MLRSALLVALVLAGSCKKDPPRGDLPPATDWKASAPSAGARPQPAPPNPHAGMPGGSPHGPTAAQTEPRALDKLPDGRLGMGPFSLAAPAAWTVKPVTSSMRAAQFVLSDKPGAEAELVVTYFGNQGAGTIESNIDRWLSQFQQPDGKPSRDVAKVEKTQFAGQDATVVSVAGRYDTGGMPGGSGPVDKADQALLAAIVGSPTGPYYFKLVGAKATVDASAAAFRSMLGSLKLR
ncbi:MAG: hypothetical protein E6J90_36215 [Deltaproteobacteria bacterium]|nr:MAG: hypothetical protein E6J90_36215 [Deltaproteobacteria bacterium]TMQ21493.1 MAG: hypothetical protein E6J91_02625 [Deltaproteobacteria bacterium]